MKIVILFSCLFFTNILCASSLQSDEIVYTFKKSSSDHCINIKTEFQGEKNGETLVVIPWKSHNHISPSYFQCDKQDGLRVVEVSPSLIKLAHAPDAKISLTYDMCYNDKVSNIELPVIEKDFFSLYAKETLIYPNKDLKENLKVTFDFSSFPNDRKVYSNFGEDKIVKVTKTIPDILFSQFVGTNVSPSIIKVKNQNIILIEHGKWSFFNKKEAKAVVKDLIQFQRNAVNDHDFPFYLITFIKQSDKVPPSISGTHAKNSLFLTFPDGPQEKFFKILYTMSHEFFHNWLGSKIEIPLEMRSQYRWFFEGFTDYFALQLAREGKFITDEQFLAILNFHLENYYSSLLSSLPNATYTKMRNGGDERYDFIQTRGHLLALQFNALLMKKNMPSNTMLSFIKDLALEASKNNQKLSEKIFWTNFNRYFDSDFKTLVDKYALAGEIIPLPHIPGFNLSPKMVNVIDPGFNLVETFNQVKIKGLDPKSAAAKAGLTENTPFLNYHFANDASSKFSVFTAINNQAIETSYLPNVMQKKIMLYSVNNQKFST